MVAQPGRSVVLAAYALLAARVTYAGNQVLSTVIYTNHGDRVPLITDNYHRLTTLGAQQMYNAGAKLRTQYIAPEPNATDQQSQIWRLPPTLLDGEFMTILTTREPYNLASAQAFMQGLYPPLFPNGSVDYIDASFYDANNNVIEGPLNGMQFPTMWSSSDQYMNSMYLKGATNCPSFTNRMINYLNGPEVSALTNGSADLYDRLSPKFLEQAVAPNVVLGYPDAWAIYDYLNYETIHNSTVAETLDSADLDRAGILASDWVFALYANTTEDGKVDQDPLNAIAGRTLAALIVNLFTQSVLSEGSVNKVNLLFGDYQPMVSFEALARLIVPQHAQFFNLPAPGASFIFELFAMSSDNSTSYPDSSELFVRFLYTNGTDQYASTIEYPLFGASPSQAVMTFSDFTTSMQSIMLSDTTQWCNLCQSGATFCLAAQEIDSGNSSSGHGVSPVIAGVIGALVTLVFVLLVLGLAMLLGGIRVYRVQNKRRSELGGFKGAEKLASDQDLTLPKGGAGAVVTEASEPRGHERVGSWELRDQAQHKDMEIGFHGHMGGTIIPRSSIDDDIRVNPYSEPVRPRDSV